MKTLLLLLRTRDAEHVMSLSTSFDIYLEDIADMEGSEEVEGVIYNIYARAISNAGMNEEDFEIDCNFSASSLYHIPTQLTIYKEEDFYKAKNIQLFEELETGLSIEEVYDNPSQLYDMRDSDPETEIKRQIVGCLTKWETDPNEMNEEEVSDMYNDLINAR